AKTKARTRARANPRARARTANGGGSSLELRRAQLEWIFLFRFFFWLLFVGLLLDGRGLGRAAEPLAAPEQPLEQRRGLVGVAAKLDAARQLDHHAARAILDGGGEDRRRLAALGVAAAQRAIAHFILRLDVRHLAQERVEARVGGGGRAELPHADRRVERLRFAGGAEVAAVVGRRLRQIAQPLDGELGLGAGRRLELVERQQHAGVEQRSRGRDLLLRARRRAQLQARLDQLAIERALDLRAAAEEAHVLD